MFDAVRVVKVCGVFLLVITRTLKLYFAAPYSMIFWLDNQKIGRYGKHARTRQLKLIGNPAFQEAEPTPDNVAKRE